MSKIKVAIVRYDTPVESVRKAVDLCHGLDHLPSKAKVFIKPNIVFWSRVVRFPKWGVVTTARTVHDMVLLLKERGIDDITIGEGTAVYDPKDLETGSHALEYLYGTLKKKYGVKCLNLFERPFEKVNLGGGVKLNFNVDILRSDFLVNVPVMKTHAQAMVSLGIKNIKGTVDLNSRKKCHSPDPEKDLNYMVSKLANKIPPSFTLIDGIYANERGPGIDGKIVRSNVLIASPDVLSADMVGAKVLGFDPAEVPHLALAAKDRNRPVDLSDVEVVGEKIENVGLHLEYSFKYNESNTLPLVMEKMGIRGIAYPKYDSTICTYCSILTGTLLTAIARAWKGQPWDDVEVLTGKAMSPIPGMKHTILLGKCMYAAHKNNPDIKNPIPVKTCPPSVDEVIQAFHQVGIDINPAILQNLDKVPEYYMSRYEGKPEFDESFFKLN